VGPTLWTGDGKFRKWDRSLTWLRADVLVIRSAGAERPGEAAHDGTRCASRPCH